MNMIKADLYRIFRTKGVYITTILLLLFISLQVISNKIGFVGVSTNTTEYFNEVNSQKFTGSIAPFVMVKYVDNLLYFILPFIIFISSADFSSGAVKNILSSGVSRTKLYLTKLFLSCFTCFLILFINIIIAITIGTILNGFGGEFNAEFIIRLLKPFSAQLFMFLAVTCVGVFFVFTTKKTASVNSLYIAFCICPVILIFMFMRINSDFEFLKKYDIISNLRMLSNFEILSTTDFTRAMLIGTFYILTSTIAGIYFFNKSEIK